MPSIPKAFPWAFIFKHRILTTQVRWGKHELPAKEFNQIYGFWRVHSSYLRGITALVHLCNEQRNKQTLLIPYFPLVDAKSLTNEWRTSLQAEVWTLLILPCHKRIAYLLSGEPSKHEADSHICSSLQNPWDKEVCGLPHLLHRPWFVISW